MQPESSLPHSQVPVACPYPKPARSSPYPPHPTSWRSILILSLHLLLRLPNGLSLRSPNQNPVHASPLPHTRYMLRPSHSWFDYPNNTGWEQIIKLLIMKFSQLVLYTLIFKFWVLQTGRQRFCTEWKQAFPDFSLPLISSRIEFLCITVVPKYLNSPRPFKGATISLHTVTSSCILISRHDHVLSFISCILYYLYRSYYCNVFFFTMTQYRCLQYVYVLQAADSELMWYVPEQQNVRTNCQNLF